MNDQTTTRRTAHLVLEAAGVVGLVATLAVFVLLFAHWTGAWFWQAAGIAVLGNTVYIIYQLARALSGTQRRSWREVVLAILVPCVALVLVSLLAGGHLGLFRLPGQAPFAGSGAGMQSFQPAIGNSSTKQTNSADK